MSKMLFVVLEECQFIFVRIDKNVLQVRYHDVKLKLFVVVVRRIIVRPSINENVFRSLQQRLGAI